MKRLLSFILMAAVLLATPKCLAFAMENADKVSVSLVGKYDSADTAAIRDIDTVRKKIRFRNHSTGKNYTLSYDNTSMIYDARGTALSAALLEPGQIVDVTFLKSTKHVTTLNVSNEAWTIENTRDHELVRGDGTANIKGEIYKIDPRTLVMADGSLALAEDVLSTDTVTVSGIGKEIYSIMVTSGHGYVSLSSETVEDQSLVGAWIELNNDVIHKISPNMLLSAPEGDYNLQIIGNGANYQSEVNISRNQETVVDTSNVNITKPKEGLVTFEIIPETAEVFVDGEKVLTQTPQSVRYGYHSLKVIADGYVTQNKYLKIGTPNSVINIELEADEASDASSEASSVTAGNIGSVPSSSASLTSIGTNIGDVSSIVSSAASTASTSSESSDSQTNKVISGYKLYFDKPYGAELYFDGSYMGMIPTSVSKISGSHEIILKMEGYETKSYRISVDSDKVDLNYTFPDLVKIEKEEEDDSSSSTSASSKASSASSDDSSASTSASFGDSSSGADSASTKDSSSEASSSTSGDSSSGADSASTKEASTEASSASSEDSSSAAASASTQEPAPSEASSEAVSSSTEGASSNFADNSQSGASNESTQPSDAASTGSTPENEN